MVYMLKLRQKDYLMLTLVWSVMITISSSIPNLKVSNVVPETDKLVHITIFAILAFLLSGTLYKNTRPWKRVAQVLLLTILFGYLDELHQSMVVGRVSSLWDLLADGIGGLTGAMLYLSFHHQQTKFRIKEE